VGMFDDVLCELPIPHEPKPQHSRFQTKDLECCLDLYTIRADGTLWRSRAEERNGLVPFHGMLNFYTYEYTSGSKEPGMWFEYEAKFTDGRCVSIECVEISRNHLGGPRETLFSRASNPTAEGR